MFIAIMKHNSTANGRHAARSTYEDAVEETHKFFLSYDFELRGGKPFDEGNDDGKAGGFECFCDVKIHNGKVAQFMHCYGDGPVCRITESA